MFNDPEMPGFDTIWNHKCVSCVASNNIISNEECETSGWANNSSGSAPLLNHWDERHEARPNRILKISQETHRAKALRNPRKHNTTESYLSQSWSCWLLFFLFDLWSEWRKLAKARFDYSGEFIFIYWIGSCLNWPPYCKNDVRKLHFLDEQTWRVRDEHLKVCIEPEYFNVWGQMKSKKNAFTNLNQTLIKAHSRCLKSHLCM
jgi:hypothetical protein